MRKRHVSLGRRLLRRLRAPLFRAIATRLPDGGPLPGWEGRGYRVLFLRPDRIGDMLMSMSAIRAIAESHPKVRLDVLASPANALLLREARFVGSVHVIRPGLSRWLNLWRTLRFARYDAVVDGQALAGAVSVRTALLLWLTRAPHRIGVGGRKFDYLYTHTVRARKAEAPLVEHLAALTRAFGVDAARVWRPELPLSHAEREQAEARWSALPGRGARVLLNVSAGGDIAPWPVDRYIAVGHALCAARPGLRVIVVGSPPAAARAEEVARALEVPAHVLPLREAMALVAAAELILTPDASLAHAGAAFARRLVTMIPRAQEAVAPYRTPGENLWVDGDDLAQLDTARVTDALLAQLAALEGDSASA